jgi:hypothetical protein
MKPLVGLAHLLRPDPGKVDTPSKYNAHIDKICEVLQARKVEVDSNDRATPEPEPELDLEDKPKKRKAKSKPNRMHEGGEDRDDAA